MSSAILFPSATTEKTPRATDHSRLYTSWSLRTIPHRMRLRGILGFVESLELPTGAAYADLGSGNGWITAQVADCIDARTADAYDATPAQLAEGRQRFPGLGFHPIDLNKPNPELEERYDFVTCLETVEHVGSPETAIRNLVSAVKPRGVGLITVPIETGLIGLGKFLVKACIGLATRQKSYFTTELDADPKTWFRYLGTLLRGGDISRYRDDRDRWGTHFGFDYRLVDRELGELDVPYRRFRVGSSMFYEIYPV